MALNLLERLRELIGAAEADVDDPDAPVEVPAEDDPVEAPEAVAAETDEEPTDDPVEAPESAEADEPETPAEDADLRETIRQQAAEIETLRNRLAELTGDTALDIDEDAVADYETDYAERQKILAALREGN